MQCLVEPYFGEAQILTMAQDSYDRNYTIIAADKYIFQGNISSDEHSFIL